MRRFNGIVICVALFDFATDEDEHEMFGFFACAIDTAAETQLRVRQ
jgi:hypothetical protein